MKPEDKADAAPTDDPFPLVAYETLVAHRALCGLIVHYLESPAQLLEGEHSSIGLVMRPQMARELAAALIAAATEAERGPDQHKRH